jgi:hypothetical protein
MVQARPAQTRRVEMQEEGAELYETQSVRPRPMFCTEEDTRWVLLDSAWRRVVLKLELESGRYQAHADLHQASRHRAYRLASEHVPQPPSPPVGSSHSRHLAASWEDPPSLAWHPCAINWCATWAR